jgi:CRP-like cAMP-binding protein
VQSGGKALRIRADDLQQAMDDLPLLRQLLLRYAQVFMIQIAATALADGRYKIEQRLARWLLMSQDRLGDKLNLTHDFLALMLGVRRPSVTDALHALEGEQMIKAARGQITIRSRESWRNWQEVPTVRRKRNIAAFESTARRQVTSGTC